MTSSDSDARKALYRQRARERRQERRDYWEQRRQERAAASAVDGPQADARPALRRKPVAPSAPEGSTEDEVLEFHVHRQRESNRLRAKAYYSANKEIVRQRLLQRRSQTPNLYAARLLLTNARSRATRDSLPFDLSLEDVLPLITRHCPALGIELTALAGRATDSSRTLDKILPELGYRKHNVAAISAFANRIKQDASAATLKQLVANFYEVPTEPGPLDALRVPWSTSSIRYKSALLYHARERANCTVTEDDFVIPDRCPLTGIKLIRGQGKLSKNSPSLDKIIPELGYVPGNVRVVSHYANRIKQNATLEEIVAVATWLEREEVRVRTALGVSAPSPA